MCHKGGMNPALKLAGGGVLRAFTLGVAATVLLQSSLCVFGQLTSTGYSVKNRNYEVLVTDYGYADLALDRRCGFEGREYLSGEWAAAVFYAGGRNPSGPIWFQPQWYYPDWISNSDFGMKTMFQLADPLVPTNMYGFKVYTSVITNRDLRVRFTYDMVKFGTNDSDRLAIGLSPSSLGGMGSFIPSGRYAFRQQYEFENISGGTLNNLKYYQFLHSLESTWGAYDDRDYGGGWSQFRYRLTEQGKSYGFDTRTMETVEHTDTLSVLFNRMPDGYELGNYGIKGVDSHEVGRPSAGVHVSVESDSFNSMDYFNTSGTGWVSGALRFPLGSLAAGEKTSITALLAIQTSYEVMYPPIDVQVRNTSISDGKYVIDFEETTHNPVVGFLLRKTSALDGMSPSSWEPQPLPYFNNFPKPGWKRFEVPLQTMEPSAFYFLDPMVINN